MANPQLEEGYTRIENEILDALVRIRIPGEARQIVDLVIRKTCGFHKEDDWIKLTQFSVKTGLKKSACARAIKKALSMNVIQKDLNDRYKLNKNYEQWEALPKQTARGKALTEKLTTVNQKDNKALTEKLTTVNQKDNKALTEKLTTVNQKDNKALTEKLTTVNQKDNKALTEKLTTVNQKDNKALTEKLTTVNQKDNKSLTEKLIPSYKRKYTKENITKESPISSSLKKFEEQKNAAYKAADLLFNQILKNNPHSRLHACQDADKEKTIQRWAKDIDLLIHIDGQEPSIVEEVICWCQQDGFWRANILSGKKLREKWDTLVAQMNRNKGVSTSKDDKRFAFLGNIHGPQKPRDAAGRILQNVTELAVEKDIDTRRPTHDEEIIDPATGNPVKVFR